jgi:hypothetical protein
MTQHRPDLVFGIATLLRGFYSEGERFQPALAYRRVTLDLDLETYPFPSADDFGAILGILVQDGFLAIDNSTGVKLLFILGH